jgi:hypothetical protein
MIERFFHKVEQHLYRRGFTAAPVRRLMAVQMVVAAACILLGLPLAFISFWPLAFGIGAALAAWGFWNVARTAQEYIRREFTRQAAFRQFLNF